MGKLTQSNLVHSILERSPLIEIIGNQHLANEALPEILRLRPQLLLIDFSLRNLILNHLDKILKFTEIAYISNVNNFALIALEDQAIDYLVAPFNSERLEKCVSKVIRLTNRRNALLYREQSPLESFFINTDFKGKSEVHIHSSELLLVEAVKSQILLTMVDGTKHFSSNTMREMENFLPNYFMRVHKSYIINYKKVSGVKGATLTLTGAKTKVVPIGITYRKSFSQRKEKMTIGKFKSNKNQDLY